MSSAHLDDDQLSTHVDPSSSDQAADSEHLRSCASCQARLGRLRTAAHAVGAPVPPPPAWRRDQAVEAALSAWDDQRRSEESEIRETPRSWAFPRWAAVAAALLVLLAAVPVVVAIGDRGGNNDSAYSGRGLPAQGGAEQSVLDGGDLGDQSDGEALGRTVSERLASSAAPAPNVPAAPGPPAAGQSGEVQRSQSALPADTGASMTRRDPPCSTEVRSTYGQGLGELIYTASLRWQGTPAVLLVYRLAGPGDQRLSHRAFVMSRDGCILLVQQGL